MNCPKFERVVKRGQIYYIHKKPPYEGSREIQTKSGRPGIIVSCDDDNYMSGTVMVVYLTSGKNIKTLRNTQFKISSGKLSRSVVKCEQVATIDKRCIGDYICDASAEDMDNLNRALLTALGYTDDKLYGLSGCTPAMISEDAQGYEIQMMQEHIKDISAQNALLLRELDNRPPIAVVEEAKNEANMYKRLYSDVLKTLAGKDI